jgi:hypothetical protein
VAEYLIQHQNFQLLELKTAGSSQAVDDPRLRDSDFTGDAINRASRLEFQTPESLLDFATKRWQERWVTTHAWDAFTLDRFLQRPFFLLVSVDAPVSLLWKRFVDRSAGLASNSELDSRNFANTNSDAKGGSLNLRTWRILFFGTISSCMKRMSVVPF